MNIIVTVLWNEKFQIYIKIEAYLLFFFRDGSSDALFPDTAAAAAAAAARILRLTPSPPNAFAAAPVVIPEACVLFFVLDPRFMMSLSFV